MPDPTCSRFQHRWLSRIAHAPVVGALGSLTLCLTACRGPQSALDPAGPAAAAIARIWWVMFGGAVVVLFLVLALLTYVTFRRGRGPQLTHPHGLIVTGGLVFPTVVLAALLVYGLAESRRVTAMDERVDVVIDVIGHRWFWEFNYRGVNGGIDAVSIEELAIPFGRLVEFRVTSADVIHSFWIPRLGGKIDAIPGRVNTLRLRATQTGAIRGQCAEFCGLEHAHMAFDVEVTDDAAFSAWLNDPVRSPGTPALVAERSEP